ncbi:hypothetical protein AVEN_189026-1 [Araneus ventricosus]|uniref:Uncharacterized protein n=1 Tax=Araneus ventricosus TaxID=182803 RepID=A0A4Y2MJN8_ARAVE|nr:hypothetical protein AVEN_189026-1 [Araneus ventricosus]
MSNRFTCSCHWGSPTCYTATDFPLEKRIPEQTDGAQLHCVNQAIKDKSLDRHKFGQILTYLLELTASLTTVHSMALLLYTVSCPQSDILCIKSSPYDFQLFQCLDYRFRRF